MKFKNVSNHVQPVKVEGEFVDVQPGEYIDCPVEIHSELFKKIVEVPVKVEEKVVEEPVILEESKEVVDVSELDKKSQERVEDLKEDLKDDGKANQSHKKKKKSKK